MFDKKSIDLYKSIIAPDSLRARVLNLQVQSAAKPGVYMFRQRRRIAFTLAASFLIIFLISFAGVNISRVSLFVCGQEAGDSPVLVSAGRLVRQYTVEPKNELLSVPLELNTHQATSMTVSSGRLSVTDTTTGEELRSGTSLNFSKSQQMYWILGDVSKTDFAELIITVKNKKTIYILSRDDLTGIWTIKKNNE